MCLKLVLGEKCTNGSKSKERITVLVGANMSGNEKLPLLVIGRSKNPRCFKNVKVPLDYAANAKAWMTGMFFVCFMFDLSSFALGAIFEDWLRKWDMKLKKEGRKVLLYIDNCSAHPSKIELECITLKFFPPNTTAMSQVCVFYLY